MLPNRPRRNRQSHPRPALVVRGLANAPTVQFNGLPLARAPAEVKIGGAPAWVIPLGEKTIGEAELEKRLPTK